MKSKSPLILAENKQKSEFSMYLFNLSSRSEVFLVILNFNRMVLLILSEIRDGLKMGEYPKIVLDCSNLFNLYRIALSVILCSICRIWSAISAIGIRAFLLKSERITLSISSIIFMTN